VESLTPVSAGHPGLIAGVVRDDSGAPIEDARVYFTHTPAPIPDLAALTSADGSFALSVPVDGMYTLECRAEGFAAIRATIASRDPGSVELTLRPQEP
jgi:hypothetical protein